MIKFVIIIGKPFCIKMNKMENSSLEVRRVFGYLFVCVAIAVSIASILSELLYLNGLPRYFFATAWLGSFGIVFGAFFAKSKQKLSLIRGRMKNSVAWPMHVKAINGACWAVPFLLIAALPEFLQYLILFGIGLGNFSTYVFMKKFSNQNNKEQLLIGLIALAAIPIAVEIDTILFSTQQDIAVLLSRMLIAVSYAIGGAFALLSRN